jgi:hypothetical protein
MAIPTGLGRFLQIAIDGSLWKVPTDGEFRTGHIASGGLVGTCPVQNDDENRVADQRIAKCR